MIWLQNIRAVIHLVQMDCLGEKGINQRSGIIGHCTKLVGGKSI